MENHVLIEQRSPLQQRLNEDTQKLEVQFLTDITKLDQNVTRATLWYSPQPLEVLPVSPSTVLSCTRQGAPSFAATYENVPWAWPPSVTLGIMVDDQTPPHKTNNGPIVRECSTLCQLSTATHPTLAPTVIQPPCNRPISLLHGFHSVTLTQTIPNSGHTAQCTEPLPVSVSS